MIYYGSADAQYTALRRVAELIKLRDQPIILKRTDQIADFNQVDIIYISKAFADRLPSIADRARRSNTLIISDESNAKRDFMINIFRDTDNSIKFEINRTNMVFERLKMHRDILLLGGTELDIAELFRESELELQTIKRELKEKKLNLNRLENELKEVALLLSQKEHNITEQNKTIKQKEAQLKELSNNLSDTAKLLSENQQELLKNEALLTSKEAELMERELKLIQQTDRISRNTNIIIDQERTLTENRLALKQKESVIDQQRFILLTLAIFTALLVGLIAYILKINRARKRTNKELLNVYKALEDSKERAELASEAKSKFLANMSHELRTPLNSIIGFSQIILCDEMLPTTLKENISIINQSGNNLLTLINDILEISKIEAGKFELFVEATYIPDLVNSIASMLKPRASSNGNVIIVEAKSVEEPVLIDAHKLHQILLNLVTNAVKFTQKGTITLTVEKLGEETYRFCVSDTGIGIATNDQENIFSPFFQVDTEYRSAGTGLGLSISNQFLKLMGSKLNLQSELGVGSTFSFELILQRASASALKHPSPSSSVIGINQNNPSLSVLIADDDQASRVLCRKMLAPFNFDVFEASNGQEALSIMDKVDIDLLLTDWTMPLMGGIELVESLKSHSHIRTPQIVMLSAHVFNSDRDKALSAGVNRFIAKPIEMNELFLAIEELTHITFIRKKSETVYQQNTEIDRADIEKLPATQLIQLKEALLELNPYKITEVINSLKNENLKLAESLHSLHNNKQHRKLWELFNLSQEKEDKL